MSSFLINLDFYIEYNPLLEDLKKSLGAKGFDFVERTKKLTEYADNRNLAGPTRTAQRLILKTDAESEDKAHDRLYSTLHRFEVKHGIEEEAGVAIIYSIKPDGQTAKPTVPLKQWAEQIQKSIDPIVKNLINDCGDVENCDEDRLTFMLSVDSDYLADLDLGLSDEDAEIEKLVDKRLDVAIDLILAKAKIALKRKNK
jgi:hypothetical protein